MSLCSCGKEFKHPKQPGRPPKKCQECRLSVPPQEGGSRATSKEIVDRLEMNLKLRGTHISQQRDK